MGKRKKIIARFGTVFFDKVEKNMASLTAKWQIDELHLIDSFSASLVFKGMSKAYGPIVMKFGIHQNDFNSEVEALTFFGDKAACRLHDVDYENRVLLEEALDPGTTLFFEQNIEERLSAFCGLYKKLHSSSGKYTEYVQSLSQPYRHSSYTDWILNVTDYIDKQPSWEEVATHMKRAKAWYLEISEAYQDQSMLHGDFHYYNILKTHKGYKTIDPKGVIGHPIFDIPRYVLNEFWDEKDVDKVDGVVEKVLATLSEALGYPKDLLSKLMYIEGAMAMCWCVEDGMHIHDKEAVLESLDRIYKYTT